MAITIQELPNHERPRERLSALGVHALSDRELLALILRSGMKGKSAIDLAADLLAEFGGVDGIRQARFEELACRPGMGPAKAATVVAALSLGHRSEQRKDRIVIRSAEDIAVAAKEHLTGFRRERVIVLVCDSKNSVRKVVVVSDGSLDRSMFPIREILNAVLRNDGRAFAIAHNHPSGDAAPSADDASVTKSIRDAASKVGLRMLGHVIVTESSWSLVTS